MDLISSLRRYAFARPRVFVVEGAGGTRARLQVERWALEHGWPMAESPPDTDVLVLCGAFTDPWGDACARLQAMLSSPAATLHVAPPGHDGAASGAAGARPLADVVVSEARYAEGLEAAAQRLWRGLAPNRPPVEAQDPQDDGNGVDHDHDHDHEGEHHHDARPGGLPMARRADDRDGLRLDVLHVPLGPALQGWPPGLALLLTLQGDVVQDVALEAREIVAHRTAPSWWNAPWRRAHGGADVQIGAAERRRAAAHLDSLTRLLFVAGDDGGFAAAASLRNAALAGHDHADLLAGVAALERRLARGRLLDRVTRGVGRLDVRAALELGVTGPALRASGRADDLRGRAYPAFDPVVALGEGDARSRWHQWLAEARQSLHLVPERQALRAVDGRLEGPRGQLPGAAAGTPSHALIAAICRTLVGQEFAVARLIVASFDPDVAEVDGPKRGPA